MAENKKNDSDLAKWIAIAVAIIIPSFVAFWNASAARHSEVLRERKVALLSALSAIDNVFSHSKMTDADKKVHDPISKKPWPIQEARSAENAIRIYCKDPQRVLEAFRTVINAHLYGQPSPATTVNWDNLEKFRQIVCEELEQPPSNGDKNWTYSLEGGE